MVSRTAVDPQTETEGWAAMFSNVEPDKRRYYRNSLGNLLLLSGSINSSLQNDDFDNKKHAQYNSEGKKVRNGYADGSHSEIEVSQQDEWGPEQIRERGLKLLSFMADRWNFTLQAEDREKLLFLGTDEEA